MRKTGTVESATDELLPTHHRAGCMEMDRDIDSAHHIVTKRMFLGFRHDSVSREMNLSVWPPTTDGSE